ncbi:PREDICTED: histone deacetylase complex subunit SAP30 [Dipodomys ordii]|uniref:Histone deacetylase complex subunit SAP30 n=1 Tax=Dipodomys ordii TaxID=10020 RepID=A0A1S3FS73_DIPOR|nr:PREDICTED: histone deacetylase complex subunit SAP30 [Dipodomys ordii]
MHAGMSSSPSRESRAQHRANLGPHLPQRTTLPVLPRGGGGRGERRCVVPAQVPGLEGGGRAAVQLLKSPCDSERAPSSSPGASRRPPLGASRQHCPLPRCRPRPAGRGRQGRLGSGRAAGDRCGRAAGNASFSKRIQKSISQKKVKIELDKSARHLYICDYHKNLIQSVRNRRKRKGSDDDGGDSPVQDIDTPEVDLYQLQVNTLRRYKRHFKLPTRPGLNKAQLVEIVGCHFRSIPVNEKDTLTYFIYSVKNDKNKSDLKVDSGVH